MTLMPKPCWTDNLRDRIGSYSKWMDGALVALTTTQSSIVRLVFDVRFGLNWLLVMLLIIKSNFLASAVKLWVGQNLELFVF